jgi:tetratricopeptide (TPR) repeat protein
VLQFNYREAARLYDNAARLVLFNLEASLSWRRKEADAFLRQGEEFADPAALLVAVKGYRIILEAAAQALGTEARALVEKELCKALRILGDREDHKQGMDHLADAVVMCENALKVLTIERNPVEWAVTKNSVAVAVMSMGARTGASQPLRHAEGMFREVLAVNALSPDDASRTKANLGLALQRLGNFGRNEKLFEEATQLFREVLMELSLERDRMTWSAVQNNRGATYRLWGGLMNSAPLLRQAEEAYEQALSVTPRERAPYRWAQITDNMALVLLLLGKCTSSNEMLQHALKLANGALEIFRQAGSKPDIDRANIRRAAIEEALKGRSSKQNCAAI